MSVASARSVVSLPGMNWFAHETAARRYADGRPDFHPLIVAEIRDRWRPPRFGVALDVGCGTGQSSRALRALADRVVAVDASRAMLSRRGPGAEAEYALAPAEALPFADGVFDAVTSGLASHWFERDRFLAEAGRLLWPGGWLILYNHWFLGRMTESPGFESWHRDEYRVRYPGPPRDLSRITEEAAAAAGLAPAGRQEFEHAWTLTREALVAHLVSQTNVIAAVEGGGTPIAEVRAWLMESTAPFFRGAPGTFRFAGSAHCYRRK
jgi:SAM-dependent methyltransferase